MKKRATKTKVTVKIKEPKKDRDLPVTKRLLDLTKQELKGDITSLRLEMKAGFSEIKTEMTKMMIMMEDQNDRNRSTIDSNALIYQKLVDHDARFEKIEEQVFGIKQR